MGTMGTFIIVCYKKANCDRYGPGWSEYTNYPVGYGAIVVAHILASLEPTMRPAKLQINWSYLTENKEIKALDYFNPVIL